MHRGLLLAAVAVAVWAGAPPDTSGNYLVNISMQHQVGVAGSR
jgi:hypothetical protein